MANQQHPITLPPELVQQWVDTLLPQGSLKAFTIAARWGADQELEACCGVLDDLNDGYWSKELRTARRPKPPNLKNQALQALESLQQRTTDPNIVEPIRRALEQLDD